MCGDKCYPGCRLSVGRRPKACVPNISNGSVLSDKTAHVITRLDSMIIIVQILVIFRMVSVQHERQVVAFSKSELRVSGLRR